MLDAGALACASAVIRPWLWRLTLRRRSRSGDGAESQSQSADQSAGQTPSQAGQRVIVSMGLATGRPEPEQT